MKAECYADNCTNDVWANGLCRKHEQRMYRYGRLHTIQEHASGMEPEDILSRYTKKTASGCVEWERSVSSHGYGSIYVDGKKVLAHRVAWMCSNGPIPKGLCVLHKCDNPLCVNPEHLFLGTRDDNMKDTAHKSRGRGGRKSLTPSQVREIRASDAPTASLAKHYGVAAGTISNVRNYHTYKQI